MTEAFPPDVQEYVRGEIAAGKYRNEEELLVEAVRFLRDSDVRLGRLREALRTRLAGLDRGDGIELEDDEALGAFFNQVEAEVHEELAAEKKQRQ